MTNQSHPPSFTWSDLGDISDGRAHLGQTMPVLVYRLFQYTLRDSLISSYGEENTRRLFHTAGHLSGTEFAKNVLDLSGDWDYFLMHLSQTLLDLKIGLMQVEKANTTTRTFVFTVSEDLDCSGLPVTGKTVCDYDEGFIAGILEVYDGIPFLVREIDCWSTGGRVCRFTAQPA